MKLFEISRKAKSDLLSIAVFTEKRWGKSRRNLYIRQLDDSFHLLGKNPELGVQCDSIRPGYRKLPQGSHVIFYKPGSNSKIFIIRILHKSMDYSSHF